MPIFPSPSNSVHEGDPLDHQDLDNNGEHPGMQQQGDVGQGLPAPQQGIAPFAPQQQVAVQDLARMDRITLPVFWNQKVALWFSSIESMFLSHRITSDVSKYHAVIARLDQDTLSVIEHIVLDPPARNRYGCIKEALLNHFSVSQERRFKTLVSGLELGDKRPSDLLAEIFRLGGNHLDETFTRTLWLDRLPQHVQVALAAADGLNISNLAQLADKILDIERFPAEQRMMPISRTQSAQLESKVEELAKQVERLAAKIDKLASTKSSGRSRSRSVTPGPGNPADDTQASSGNCYYHRRFKEKASKCTKPCTWTAHQGNDPHHQ